MLVFNETYALPNVVKLLLGRMMMKDTQVASQHRKRSFHDFFERILSVTHDGRLLRDRENMGVLAGGVEEAERVR